MAMRFILALLVLVLPMTAAAADPIVIAHRGASGERPEHTLAAYELAILQGADYVEPDLVLTKDGVLVARHENEISETTDVALRPEFADRKTTKTIDGEKFTGWFTEDLTLAELKTLRARERLPQLRGFNTGYNGLYHVPTFEEIIQLVKAAEEQLDRRIGIYPETKHPSYFAAIGLPHEAPLLAMLQKYGYRQSSDPIFIQSFEVGNLEALRAKTRLRLIQLMANEGGPADRSSATYREMATPAGLKQIAAYADGVGVAKDMVIPRGADGQLTTPTSLAADAQKAGLAVHVWTFRRENFFLAGEYRVGEAPMATGNLAAELRAFLATGIDGLFSDNVAEAVAAVRRQP